MSNAVRAGVDARYGAPVRSFFIEPGPATILPFGAGFVLLIPGSVVGHAVETQPPPISLHLHSPDPHDAPFLVEAFVVVLAFATVAAKVGPWIVCTSDELRIAIEKARRRPDATRVRRENDARAVRERDGARRERMP